MSKATEREDFIFEMTREFPTVSLNLLRKLMRLAKGHKRHMENECNIADYDTSKGNRAESKIVALIKECLPGCQAIIGGDPRGCTVKLKVPSGKTNDFGNEGICVPQ